MAQNALLALSRPWNFGVPSVDNFFQPVNQGINAGLADRQRNIENRRADEQMGMQRERLDIAKQGAARQAEAQKVAEIGRMAGYADSLKDEGQRKVFWGRIVGSHPEMAGLLTKYGVDPNDHVNGPRFLMAQAGQYDPRGDAERDAKLALTNAQTKLALSNADKAGREGNAATGLVPIWGLDAAGKPVVMQPTKDGRLVQSGMPSGVTAMPPEMIVARKKDAEVQAKAQAEAKANLPVVESNAKVMFDMIDGVVGNKDKNIPEHPALGRFTGFQGIGPNISLEARDLRSRIDQISGKAFLEAFNSLRGGGQITEAEGSKATQALSRLAKTDIGSDAYKRAANDLRNEVQRLVQLAKKKAGVGDRLPQSQPQQNAGGPVRVGSPDEAMRLPPGTVFMTPDGRMKVRP